MPGAGDNCFLHACLHRRLHAVTRRSQHLSNGHAAPRTRAARTGPARAATILPLLHWSVCIVADVCRSYPRRLHPFLPQVTVLMPKNGPKLKPEQSLVLVGSSAALGRWDPANGLPLERAGEDSPMWTSQAELPLGDSLQAKVGRRRGGRERVLDWGGWVGGHLSLIHISQGIVR